MRQKPNSSKGTERKRPYKDDDKSSRSGDSKPFKRSGGDAKPSADGKRSFDSSEKRGAGRSFSDFKKDGQRKDRPAFGAGRDRNEGDSKPFARREQKEDKPFRKKYEDNTGRSSARGDASDRDKKPYGRPAQREGTYDKFPKKDERSKSDTPFRKKYEGGDDKPVDRKPFDRDKKPFVRSDRKEGGSDRPFKRSDDSKGDTPFRKKYEDRGDKPAERKPYDRDRKPYGKSNKREGDSERPARRTDDSDSNTPFRKKYEDGGDKPERKPYERSDRKEGDSERRPFVKRADGERTDRNAYGKPFSKPGKPSFKKNEEGDEENPFDKPFPLGTRKVSGPFRKKFNEEKEKINEEKAEGVYEEKPAPAKAKRSDDDAEKEMTLNKFISHSGECSRREAAALVKQGKVKVNGELMLDPGYRVQSEDQVQIAGKKLTPQRDFVYILINKPKGFITTTDDPEGRKTVMELVENAAEIGRLYSVGRLDRNTTGLLLLTNDGDLAQKLAHPSYEIKKVYQVTLDKPVTKADFEKILNGFELEDGEIKVDALSYLETKNELGLEIHNGRNRIVRRIFEALGYAVEKLDRVMYAGLTKKNLPRSKWRFLTEREIVLLKHFKS